MRRLSGTDLLLVMGSLSWLVKNPHKDGARRRDRTVYRRTPHPSLRLLASEDSGSTGCNRSTPFGVRSARVSMKTIAFRDYFILALLACPACGLRTEIDSSPNSSTGGTSTAVANADASPGTGGNSSASAASVGTPDASTSPSTTDAAVVPDSVQAPKQDASFAPSSINTPSAADAAGMPPRTDGATLPGRPDAAGGPPGRDAGFSQSSDVRPQIPGGGTGGGIFGRDGGFFVRETGGFPFGGSDGGRAPGGPGRGTAPGGGRAPGGGTPPGGGGFPGGGAAPGGGTP